MGGLVWYGMRVEWQLMKAHAREEQLLHAQHRQEQQDLFREQDSGIAQQMKGLRRLEDAGKGFGYNVRRCDH